MNINVVFPKGCRLGIWVELPIQRHSWYKIWTGSIAKLPDVCGLMCVTDTSFMLPYLGYTLITGLNDWLYCAVYIYILHSLNSKWCGVSLVLTHTCPIHGSFPFLCVGCSHCCLSGPKSLNPDTLRWYMLIKAAFYDTTLPNINPTPHPPHLNLRCPALPPHLPHHLTPFHSNHPQVFFSRLQVKRIRSWDVS